MVTTTDIQFLQNQVKSLTIENNLFQVLLELYSTLNKSYGFADDQNITLALNVLSGFFGAQTVSILKCIDGDYELEFKSSNQVPSTKENHQYFTIDSNHMLLLENIDNPIIDISYVNYVIPLFKDIIKRIDMEKSYVVKANTDDFTGFYNKGYFNSVKEELKKENIPICFISLDLNRLKHINDSYGHEAGDIYIQNFCSLVAKYFLGDLVFRTGGDEFIILSYTTDSSIIEDRLFNLKKELFRVIKEVDGKTIPAPTFSCGYAIGDSSEIDTLSSISDGNMYTDKSKFYNLVNFSRRKN